MKVMTEKLGNYRSFCTNICSNQYLWNFKVYEPNLLKAYQFVKANCRAIKGLGLLGYPKKVSLVVAALVDIRSTLK